LDGSADKDFLISKLGGILSGGLGGALEMCCSISDRAGAFVSADYFFAGQSLQWQWALTLHISCFRIFSL
jgi:hypothetical protein